MSVTAMHYSMETSPRKRFTTHALRCVVLFAVVMLSSGIGLGMARAQTLDEADFFLDEDAWFGGDGGLLTEADQSVGDNLEEVFLVRPGIDIGLSYWGSVGVQRISGPGLGYAAGSDLDWTVDGGGTLYVDARPSRSFRAFGKVRTDAHVAGRSATADVRLHELFVDFSASDRAFYRLGKQTVHWGVGYFFSPADIINLGRIDPERPEADREGPTALRIHVPAGRNNFYLYTISGDDWATGPDVAVAPKAEFVLGGTEWGAGLYYRPARAPRAMATMSTTLGPMSVFGEATVSVGSDKRFVRPTTPTPADPLGVKAVMDREGLYAHATLGALWTYSDPDRRFSFTGAGQYYYNGEGYDGDFLKNHQIGISQLFLLGRLTPRDVQQTGRHYAAVTGSVSGDVFRDMTATLFWLGNVSDGSGMGTVSVMFSGWGRITPSISVSHTYGDRGTEYGLAGPITRIMAEISIGGEL